MDMQMSVLTVVGVGEGAQQLQASSQHVLQHEQEKQQPTDAEIIETINSKHAVAAIRESNAILAPCYKTKRKTWFNWNHIIESLNTTQWEKTMERAVIQNQNTTFQFGIKFLKTFCLNSQEWSRHVHQLLFNGPVTPTRDHDGAPTAT